MHSSKDTIAAIATAPGTGGLAVIRISGPAAREVLGKVFVPAKGGASFAFKPRFMHYGQARDAEDGFLDEVLAVFMPGPGTATGEDVGELHCHGGTGVSAGLLEAVLAAGARLAGRGEFTRRAFLNGRIDLTQAEAVAELIAAPGKEGVRLAGAKLEGVLGKAVADIRAALEGLRARVIVAVDFPEEDEDILDRASFAAELTAAEDSVGRLLAGFERARLWREGATAALVGRVNAGKSSLLNALLGRNRAIVSAAPGTTRDYIEETVLLGGLPVRVLDTAGLRRAGDAVEEEGIRRSRDLAEQADLLLLVLDRGENPASEDFEFLAQHAAKARSGGVIVVWNKSDAEEGLPNVPLSEAYSEVWAACPAVAVSARTGFGLDVLGETAAKALRGSAEGGGADLAPNLRQSELLRATGKELALLRAALADGLPPDILGVHLDTATSLLDEVTGSAGTEELLDRIFASFCIGK